MGVAILNAFLDQIKGSYKAWSYRIIDKRCLVRRRFLPLFCESKVLIFSI